MKIFTVLALLLCLSEAAFKMDEIVRAANKAKTTMNHPPKELLEAATMISENKQVPKPMLLKASKQADVVMKGKRYV